MQKINVFRYTSVYPKNWIFVICKRGIFLLLLVSQRPFNVAASNVQAVEATFSVLLHTMHAFPIASSVARR